MLSAALNYLTSQVNPSLITSNIIKNQSYWNGSNVVFFFHVRRRPYDRWFNRAFMACIERNDKHDQHVGNKNEMMRCMVRKLSTSLRDIISLTLNFQESKPTKPCFPAANDITGTVRTDLRSTTYKEVLWRLKRKLGERTGKRKIKLWSSPRFLVLLISRWFSSGLPFVGRFPHNKPQDILCLVFWVTLETFFLFPLSSCWWVPWSWSLRLLERIPDHLAAWMTQDLNEGWKSWSWWRKKRDYPES